MAWSAADVKLMAVEIRRSLPMSVAQVLGKDWVGGALVQLEDALTRPTAEDIVLNACWMKPVVRKFRDRVPSSFYLANVFLALDDLWLGRLLIPLEKGDSKQSLAAAEAKKVKALIGALRALWRSSLLSQMVVGPLGLSFRVCVKRFFSCRMNIIDKFHQLLERR